MADKTGIAWTNATWNPIVGCSIVSPGCTNCYAQREAGGRLRHTGKFKGLTQESKAGPVWTGEVRLWEPAIDQPLRWKNPRMIFVNSMSDVFHESVPDSWIERIFAVMALCPQHTFQILTKRAGRMRDYLRDPRLRLPHLLCGGSGCNYCGGYDGRVPWLGYPLPNCWLGVSVEDQARADERIPLLLDTPAAIRWVSLEPLLGPVDLWNLRDGTFDAITGCGNRERLGEWEPTPSLDWVVAGGESGSGARPFNIEWARSIIAQCKAAGVACFVKQLGSRPFAEYPADAPGEVTADYIGLRDRKGGDPAGWSEDLRVREYPAQERA